MANPIGTPCKKYSKTSNRKFRLSCLGSSENPLEACSLSCPLAIAGTGSSRENVDLFMRCAVAVALSELSSAACLRRCSRRFPSIAPDAFPFRLREDSEDVCRACVLGDAFLLPICACSEVSSSRFAWRRGMAAVLGSWSESELDRLREVNLCDCGMEEGVSYC